MVSIDSIETGNTNRGWGVNEKSHARVGGQLERMRPRTGM